MSFKVRSLTAIIGVLGAIGLPQGSQAVEYKSGENIQLKGEFSDNLVAAGGTIHANFLSTDDVFMAGGEISYRSKGSKDLFLAGGDVDLADAEGDLAALTGGSVSLTSSKFREVIIGGGQVHLEGLEVADDLMVGAGELTVDAETTVTGGATLAAGNVTLNGRFWEDVEVSAGELNLGPNAVIDGNLSYRAENVTIDPSATIRGKTESLPLAKTPDFKLGFLGAFTTILLLLGFLVTAPVVVLIFPRLAEQGREIIRDNFWVPMGKGALAALATPLILLILFGSVVGLPLGVCFLAFLGASLIVAWSAVVFTLGDLVRKWIFKKKDLPPLNRYNQFGWTAVGALILSVLAIVPIFGFAVGLLTVLIGLGIVTESIEKWIF